jgi:NADH-quinone oxidoreductase subunit N
MSDLLAFDSIFTEIVLVISSLLLILFGVIFDKFVKDSKVPSIIAILVLAACVYIVFTNCQDQPLTTFNNLFLTNNYIAFAKVVIMLSAIISILFSMGYSSINKIYLKFEFPSLILFSVLGMLVMISANDFMSLYLGLELQALCLYTLTCFNRSDIKSSESALKYFILGGIASAVILYGISFIYGFSGTSNFSVFEEIYGAYVGGKEVSFGVLIGSILVIAGFCFKIAVVPFHMWAPDVYQGAPLPVSAFLSTTPKAASIFVLAKLLISTFNIWADVWQQVITVIAVLSLFMGALGALKQLDIKRLLAYSSINHIGFILIGIVARNQVGLEAVVIYTCIYISMNIGIYACVSMMQKPDNENFDLDIFKGLAKHNPVVALAIAILLLSLAGIPPFAGFLAKFYILNAAIKSELYILSVLAMLSAIISTFCYLKIIKMMYFDENSAGSSDKLYTVENVIIASSAATFNLILILFPSSLYGTVFFAVSGLFR